ncbi:MAG: relaxase/mobilization nuclease domain-containing protein, partial [Myxococcota bacterium]
MNAAHSHTLDDAPRARRAPEQQVTVPRSRPQSSRAGGSAQPAVKLCPAAVVKVAGYRHSVQGVADTIAYIADKADLAQDDWARDLSERDGKPTIDLPSEWGLRNDDGRLAVHVILSLPNRDPEIEWQAAAAAARECFANSPYYMALHTDTGKPHVHLVVRVRDYNGRKLRTDPDDLHEYCKALARAGRERGIEVEARRYDVPTRLRDYFCYSKVERVERTLERHVRVLQRGVDSTPAQLRAACKAVRKHRDQLRDSQRRIVLSAAGKLGAYPELRATSRQLTKLVFKGPRGDRFATRERQREDIKTLSMAGGTAVAQAVDKTAAATERPSAKTDVRASDATEAVAALDRAQDKHRRRAAARLRRQARELTPSTRLALRRQLAENSTDRPPRYVRRLERTLVKTASPEENTRIELDRALRVVTTDASSDARATRRALKTLARHRDQLEPTDRLAIGRDAVPRLSDKQRSAAMALARRPKSVRERVAETARSAVAAVTGKERQQEPVTVVPSRPQEEIAEAMKALATPEVSKKRATQAALATLARQHGQLTEKQRTALRQQIAPTLSGSARDRALELACPAPDLRQTAVAAGLAAAVATTQPGSEPAKSTEPGPAGHADPADRAQAEASQGRDAIDGALAVLRSERTSNHQLRKRALVTLTRHRGELAFADRKALIRDIADHLPGRERRVALALARRPRRGQKLALAAALGTAVAVTRSEKPSRPEPAQVIEAALDQLTGSPAVDPAGAARALDTLHRQVDHLSGDHRQRMLDTAQRWTEQKSPTPAEREAVAAHSREVERLVQRGQGGAAFYRRHQQRRIQVALNMLDRSASGPAATADNLRLVDLKAAAAAL